MVKVIKQGKPKKDKKLTVTCNECESTLEAFVGEFKHHADFRDGSYYSLTCPVCKKPVTIASDLLEQRAK